MPIPYQTVPTPANANVLNNDLYDHCMHAADDAIENAIYITKHANEHVDGC